MLADDWPTGSAVKRDLDEEIVQAAVADDEARKGLLDGIEDAKTDGDGRGVSKLTTLLGEVDRRRRVQDRVRVAGRPAPTRHAAHPDLIAALRAPFAAHICTAFARLRSRFRRRSVAVQSIVCGCAWCEGTNAGTSATRPLERPARITAVPRHDELRRAGPGPSRRLDARRRRCAPHLQGGAGSRRLLLRLRRRVRHRRQRASRRCAAEGTPPARRICPRHQGLHADGAGCESGRPIAQACTRRRGCQPLAPRPTTTSISW